MVVDGVHSRINVIVAPSAPVGTPCPTAPVPLRRETFTAHTGPFSYSTDTCSVPSALRAVPRLMRRTSMGGNSLHIGQHGLTPATVLVARLQEPLLPK